MHDGEFYGLFFKRTSTEAHVNMRRHQDAKVKQFDVSNVIYHKFSHDAASYTLNGEKRQRHVRIDDIANLQLIILYKIA